MVAAPSAAPLLPAGDWPRPQGLLLDAMGTLIGLRASVGHTYAAVASEHGLAVSAAAIDAAFAAVYRQAPPLAFPGLEGAALAEAERHWWGERIAAVFAIAAATPAPPALGDALFDRFADPALWFVYPDVPQALRRWRAAGLRLAVVSNFDSRLDALLAGLGLAPWLDLVVVSSRAGAAKPSAQPFRQALAGLGLAPHQAWHVGDSPEDGAGARAAGLPCLLLQRR